MGGEGPELGALEQLNVESVQEERLKIGRPIADRAQPLWLLLVHAQVGVRVEALEVVAGGGAGGVGHPSHAQRTRHRHLHTTGVDPDSYWIRTRYLNGLLGPYSEYGSGCRLTNLSIAPFGIK